MRLVSEHELAGLLRRTAEGRRVIASGNYATPQTVLDILDREAAEFRLVMLNAQPGIPDRPGIVLETPFVGAGMRGSPNLRYFPCRLSLVPYLLTGALAPDIAIVHTSAPHDGTVSLGTEVNILPAAIEAVRRRSGLVIAQINPHMPYTYGDGVIPLDEIDYGIEVDEPLAEPPSRPPGDLASAIAQHVAGLVVDGATLQLGIGAVPDATLAALHGRRSLRIWSEMFSDGVLSLERAGALDPDRPITASFSFGSAELYEWVDHNPRVRLLRTEKTNDPARIAEQHALTSINSALQVDLFGQANAAYVPHRIHSGFGGQPDFVVGALHSPGGKAIIALPSWHAKTDTSTVVPMVSGPVTSFQHSYVVSEHGCALIWGGDTASQARDIVGNVADPRARDGLREAGREIGFRI